MNGSCISALDTRELFGLSINFSEAKDTCRKMSRYVSQKCKHTRCPGRQAWVWNSARWGWSFSNSLSKPSIPTAMKERTEVHGFFKQVSAGVSNGVRIKGGGAALTREKIIASVAKKFICIADASKEVDILGNFPLPVEVIPMARSAVARQLVKLGGRPEYRQGVVTDNGNVILDAVAMENAINAIPGVVTVGLFANRGADVALIGTPDGVKTIVK
mgnify:CR=1 FL=1